VTGKFDASA